MADKVKLRATVTAVLVYEADPEDYAQDPSEITPEAMAKDDAMYVGDGDFLVWDHPDAKHSWKVEVVK
jgi:hypothetical protein